MSDPGPTEPSPPVLRHRRSLATSAAVVAMVVVLGTSCSGTDTTTTATSTSEPPSRSTGQTSTSDGSESSPSDTSTGPSTSTPSPEPLATDQSGQPLSAEHQEILDRYTGYWDARFAANTGTPYPADPALAEYATGAQLDAVIAETQANLDEGRAFRENPDPVHYREVTIVSVDGDRAEVQECVVDDRLVINRDTGDVLNGDVATHNVSGTLRRVDGVWRVSGTSLVQLWEGVAGCALAS